MEILDEASRGLSNKTSAPVRYLGRTATMTASGRVM